MHSDDKSKDNYQKNPNSESKQTNSLRGLHSDEDKNKLPLGVKRSQLNAGHKRKKKSTGSYQLGVAGLAGGIFLGIIALTWWGLPRRAIMVSIDSIPQGVDAFVDGQRVGVTPVKYRSARRHKTIHVELRGEHMQSYQKDIELPLFGSVAPIRAAMPLSRAHLRLMSKPDKVQLFVDGRAQCSSPCELDNLSPRQMHVLRFEHEGCAPYWDVVEGEPDERLLVRADLKPEGVQNLVLLRILTLKKPVIFDGDDLTEAFAAGAVFVRAGRHLLKMGHGENAQRDLVVLSAGSSQRLVFGGADLAPPQPRLKAEGNDLDINETGGMQNVPGAQEDQEDLLKPKLVAATVDSLANYGLYLLARGQASEAKDFFVQALSLDRESPRAHRGIIASATDLGDFRLARGQLAALLDLHIELPDRDLLRDVYTNAAKAQLCHSEKDSPK